METPFAVKDHSLNLVWKPVQRYLNLGDALMEPRRLSSATDLTFLPTLCYMSYWVCKLDSTER